MFGSAAFPDEPNGYVPVWRFTSGDSHMPRLVQSIPKYRKHRASGPAIVELNGKRHYLGPHNTKVSKEEYDRVVQEWLASGRSSNFGTPSFQLTIVELLADYLRQTCATYFGNGPNSELNHIVRVCRQLRELYGRSLAAEFGPLQFKAVRGKLIDDGFARNTINAAMRRVTKELQNGESPKGVSPPRSRRL